MNLSPRRLFAASAVVLAALAGTWLLRSSAPSHGDAASTPAVAPGDRGRLALEPGTRQLLRFRFTSSQRVALLEGAGGDGSGSSTLEGDVDVALDVESADAQGATVALTVDTVRGFQMKVLGQDALPDAASAEAALRAGPCRLQVLRDGRVSSVGFEQGASAAFTSLVHTLLTEAQLQLGDGAAWDGEELSAVARVTARYEWEGAGSTRSGTLRKRQGEVKEVRAQLGGTVAHRHATGSATFRFESGRTWAAEGQRTLQLLDGTGQTLLLLQAQWALSELSRGPAVAQRPLAAAVVHRPEDSAVAPGTGEDALSQRVAGMTSAELITGLPGIAADLRSPERQRWFWRGSGLLRQQPEALQELENWLSAAPRTLPERTLSLDLLAAAGTPAAQRLLRDTVERAPAAEAPSLLQHAAMVERPSAETVAWVTARYDAASGAAHQAAALTLGALVRRLAVAGDGAGAAAALSHLASGLSAATEAREVEAHVRGLGNAGIPAAAGPLLALKADGRPSVRAAVAAALRHLQGADVTGALLELCVDGAPPVQREALRSLTDQPADGAKVQSLRGLMATGRFGPGSQNALVNLLSAWRPKLRPEVDAALETLLAQPKLEPDVAARARALRAQDEAGR